MTQVNQAMAIRRFSNKYNLDYGLGDCYDISTLVRLSALKDLLHPELKEALRQAFKEDRASELLRNK